jgi:type I restriction enzyme, S subunit
MSAMQHVVLRDVAQIERDIVDPSEIEEGTLYVGLENIESGGRFVGVRPVDAGELLSSKFSFSPRHLLYGKLRPYLAKIARPEFDGICSTDILPVLPGPDVDRSYLAWLLLSPHMVAQASSRATGANLPRLSPNALAELQIPLPPLPEQRRIAEILDKADALRVKRRAAIAQLDTLAQYIFLEMFGDPLANPRSWPKKKLSELGSLDRGVSKHRPRNAPELLGGPYPFVQTGDVANCGGYITTYSATYSEAGLRQSKMWPAGTLCITIAANIAKTGILTFDGCFPDSVVGFRADEPATVEFVRCWLSFLQASLEEMAPESAQKNINLAILRGLDVPTPDISQRKEFARRIEAVEAIKSDERAAQAMLNVLFASLQYRAFRGDL